MRIISFIAAMMLSALAFATGTQTNALVSSINLQGTQFLVEFASANATPAGCVGGGQDNQYFGIDPSTSIGKAYISAVELALTTGRTVSAHGTGACTIFSGIEDLGYFQTTD